MSEIPATSLARNKDTVDLGDGKTKAISTLLWVGVTALGAYALFFRRRPSLRGPGPDAVDELATEARRIQRRVEQRRRR